MLGVVGVHKAAKVLIVDDELMVHVILDQLVKKYGFEPLKATCGDEAEQQVEAHAPELILLDILIPGSDSMALLESFRRNPTLKHSRIIVVTGSNDLNIIGNYIAAGADDYILKPFHATLLKTRLIHALDRIEQSQNIDKVQAILSEVTGKLQQSVEESAEYSKDLNCGLNNVLLGVGKSSQLLRSAEK